MYSKKVVIVLFLLIGFCVSAQKSINDYKYIIVPKTYAFFKTEDLYQLNSLTKFLYNKYGYEAYFIDDELPEDLKSNRCLALKSELSNDNNSLFKTKLEFILKDCLGVVVLTSELGESRKKELDKAYTEALRNAFESLQNLDYKYVPKQDVPKIAVLAPVKELAEHADAITPEVLNVKNETIVVKQSSDQFYYAQAIENGFQLVDAEPKIVMILWQTAAVDVFMVKGKSAIVFKEDGFWYYSENNGQLGEKLRLNIKF